MQQKIELNQFVPSSKQMAFADTVVNEVMPVVDTNPTRGGQILEQALLHHADGRYLWAIAYEEVGGGSWYESNVSGAREKLTSMATIYAKRTLTVIKCDSAIDEHAVLPVGNSGSTVRVYEITPQMSAFADAFEQSMIEQVLPAVNLHPANRIGHSTDGLMFLKDDDLPRSTEDAGTYLWLVSHTVFEQFKDRDNFPDNVRPALEKLNSIGVINGLNDYQVLRPNKHLRIDRPIL
jgi:hypothetical protein